MMPERPLFWGIHQPWLFYLLAALALVIFGFGVALRVRPWFGDHNPFSRLTGAGLLRARFRWWGR